MFRDEIAALAFAHARAGRRQILRAGLVGGGAKREIGQSLLAGNDRSISRMRSREMNGERADRMSAKDAVAGDDDLKLVDIMKVRRDRCAGLLLDQEGLRLAHLRGLRIGVFWRLCIDKLLGAAGRRRADELGAPDDFSVSGFARKARS